MWCVGVCKHLGVTSKCWVSHVWASLLGQQPLKLELVVLRSLVPLHRACSRCLLPALLLTGTVGKTRWSWACGKGTVPPSVCSTVISGAGLPKPWQTCTGAGHSLSHGHGDQPFPPEAELVPLSPPAEANTRLCSKALKMCGRMYMLLQVQEHDGQQLEKCAALSATFLLSGWTCSVFRALMWSPERCYSS